MSVLVVGSVALDDVRTPFGDVKNALGGSCSYASTAVSYFSDPSIAGVVGGDFPQEHIELFKSRGINTDALEVAPEGKTFHWTGYYEYDMNQAHTVDTQLNVFADFNPVIPESLRKARYVMLGNLDPELQLKVLDQLEGPELVMADTMNFWIDIKRDALMEVVKRCDVMLMNDAEARQLCDTVSLQKAARELMNLGVGRVIIKKGEHGCLMFSNGSYFCAPAFPLEVVHDPTGAGDTFAGGFIGYLARSEELTEDVFRQAVIVGTTMASFTVEKFSLDRLANLDPAEITERCGLLRSHTEFPVIKVDLREKLAV